MREHLPTQPSASSARPAGRDPSHGLTAAAWNIRGAGLRRFGPPQLLRAIPEGERANVLIHGLAALVFAVLGYGLLRDSATTSSAAFTLSVAVFVVSLIVAYLCSALYHGTRAAARKALLRRLDHSSIYLLIAATYTPFATELGGGWGALLLAIVWPAALLGIALKLSSPVRRAASSVGVYVAMGWLVLIAAGPLIDHFTGVTLAYLALGGVAYTLGTPFYLLSSRPWMHALWHGFVVIGGCFHFAAVASLVGHA
jgi:hemolysin III